jgi:hypothetical protein
VIEFIKNNWHKTLALLLLASLLFYAALELDFKSPQQENSSTEKQTDPQTLTNKQGNVSTQQPPDTETRKTLEKILSNTQYQTDLPSQKIPNQKPIDFPNWLAVLLKWLFIAGGIAAIAAFIWLLVSSMTGGGTPMAPNKKNIVRPTFSKTDNTETVSSPVNLQDAEAMAQKGDFGEAIHFLLLALLQHLSKLDLLRLRPSHTSREILQKAQFNTSATEAFQFLIGAVESYLFAKTTIDANTYNVCRSKYDILLSEVKSTTKNPNNKKGLTDH